MPPIRGARCAFLPGVLESLNKRQNLSRTNQLFVWLSLNTVLVLYLLLDIFMYSYSLAQKMDDLLAFDLYDVNRWVECVLLSLITLNLLVLLCKMVYPYLQYNPALTVVEKKLLGFKYKDNVILSNKISAGLVKASSKCLNFDWLFNVRPHPHTLHPSSTFPGSLATKNVTTFHDSTQTPASPDAFHRSFYDTPTSMYKSSGFQAYTPGGGTPDLSYNTSLSTINSYPSPNQSDIKLDSSLAYFSQQANSHNHNVSTNYERPPSFAEMLMRLRRARSCSPMVEKIRSQKELVKYLDDFNKSNVSNTINQSLYTTHLDTSFRMSEGFAPRKFEPGVASPKSTIPFDDFMDPSCDILSPEKKIASLVSSPDKSNVNTSLNAYNTSSLAPNPQTHLSVWLRFDIEEDYLDVYCQNLRCWISTTILRPLVRQIDLINQFLNGENRGDLCLGVGSLLTLQHSAQWNPALQKQLNPLIPYLELSNSQSYFIDRVRQLSSDACLRDFKFDAGGPEKLTKGAVAWSDHLPSDSQLLWHCLCSYLDSQLPPHPQSAKQDKPFSSIYTVQAGNKLNAIQNVKNSLYFVVHTGPTCSTQLMFDGQLLQVPQDANSMKELGKLIWDLLD